MTLTRCWKGALLGEREKTGLKSLNLTPTSWFSWGHFRSYAAESSILTFDHQLGQFEGCSLMVLKTWAGDFPVIWNKTNRFQHCLGSFCTPLWVHRQDWNTEILVLAKPPTDEIRFLTNPGRDAETLYFTWRTISKSPTTPALTAVKTPPKAAWI